MFLLHITIILTVIYRKVSTSSSDENCRILVLGGGGDRGAWQGGAMKAIVEFIDNTRYRLVSGTSIGGVNAGLFSQSKIGDEETGAKYVENFWKTITREDIYTEWPLGILQGFFEKPGLFNTEIAIKKTFYEYLNITKFRDSDRKTFIGSTNLATGKFVHFNWTTPDMPLAIAASTAIPGIFPPVLINGFYHVDGGESGNAPVTLLIEKAQELFPNECVTSDIHGGQNSIVVDVVYSLSDVKTPEYVKDHLITPFVLIEAGFGIVNDILMNDLQYAEEAFPNVEVNVFKPGVPLESLLITFDHEEMLKMFEIGYNEAKQQILG